MPNVQYLVDRLPISVVMLDNERRVISYNDAAAQAFGADRIGSYLGSAISAMHLEASQDKVDWLITSADSQAPAYASMIINVPETMLQLRVMRLHGEDGPTGYVLLAYDITQLASEPADLSASDQDSARLRLAKLPVSVQGQIALVDLRHVTYIRAKGHYAQVHTLERDFFCNMSLGQIESRLPTAKFMRIHRSCLVNLDYVCRIERQGDNLLLHMQGVQHATIAASRSVSPKLRELFGV